MIISTIQLMIMHCACGGVVREVLGRLWRSNGCSVDVVLKRLNVTHTSIVRTYETVSTAVEA